jgi:hypothetical protein
MSKVTIWRNRHLEVRTDETFTWMVKYLGEWCPVEQMPQEDIRTIFYAAQNPGFPSTLRTFLMHLIHEQVQLRPYQQSRGVTTSTVWHDKRKPKSAG